eukprot:g6122.t1
MANMSAKFCKGAFVGWTDVFGLHYPFGFEEDKVRKQDDRKKFLLRKQKLYKKHELWVSMIIPFTFGCEACGTQQNLGKKMTMKMELIRDDFTFGFQNYRFYGHCTDCGALFTFRTDPEAAGGYRLETGGTRRYEEADDRCAMDHAEIDAKAQIQDEKMTALQQKQEEAKAEMARADNLEQLMYMGKEKKDHFALIMAALENLADSKLLGPVDSVGDSLGGSKKSVGAAAGSNAGSSATLELGAGDDEGAPPDIANMADFEDFLEDEWRRAQVDYEVDLKEEKSKLLDLELDKVNAAQGMSAEAQKEEERRVERKKLGTTVPGNEKINKFMKMFDGKVGKAAGPSTAKAKKLHLQDVDGVDSESGSAGDVGKANQPETSAIIGGAASSSNKRKTVVDYSSSSED